jgi:hypothetical protein
MLFHRVSSRATRLSSSRIISSMAVSFFAHSVRRSKFSRTRESNSSGDTRAAFRALSSPRPSSTRLMRSFSRIRVRCDRFCEEELGQHHMIVKGMEHAAPDLSSVGAECGSKLMESLQHVDAPGVNRDAVCAPRFLGGSMRGDFRTFCGVCRPHHRISRLLRGICRAPCRDVREQGHNKGDESDPVISSHPRHAVTRPRPECVCATHLAAPRGRTLGLGDTSVQRRWVADRDDDRRVRVS